MIDEDPRSAARLAEHLNNTAVFNGSVMSDVVLAEAGIADADAAVAVTGEDKDNIIAAMIARKNGVENTFALVNSRSANTQMINVGENILIDRTTITISAILKELRKVRLNNACTLGLSGEVWEIAVDGNSTLIGSTFAQLGLPEESRVCALIRKGETRFCPRRTSRWKKATCWSFCRAVVNSPGGKNLCIIIPLFHNNSLLFLQNRVTIGQTTNNNKKEYRTMSQKVQEDFLGDIRKNEIAVTVFLINGVKLQGVITWFDDASILLRRDGHTQLIYKHAVSTIMPGVAVDIAAKADKE